MGNKYQAWLDAQLAEASETANEKLRKLEQAKNGQIELYRQAFEKLQEASHAEAQQAANAAPTPAYTAGHAQQGMPRSGSP